MTCPVYAGEQVDAGPRCCDLSCRWPGEHAATLAELELDGRGAE